jgi:hypothetical protein
VPIVAIQNFFTGKTLVIPNYQRDYAWKERNINDLFGDIEEALAVSGSHYLGTFILSQQNRLANAEVVDGQQRLTTLTLILDALIDELENTPFIQQHYRNIFIEDPVNGAKFRMQKENEIFFSDLINAGKVAGKKLPTPLSNGQDRLLHAYKWIRERVKAVKDQGGQEAVQRWLMCISSMEVMEFIEPDQGRAIRMFQSVNDRGVPLAKMDIVKSLLISYSNIYLEGQLDTWIADNFGQSFRSFSHIKRLAGESCYEIRHINREAFREDDVLRYHYLAFDGQSLNVETGADFTATSETVLNVFLKPTLQRLRSDKDKLKAFIETYVKDLTAFFGALEELVQSTRTDLASYLLWVVQDLSATLYPLVIRLHLIGWTNQIATADSRTLLQLIELVDLRVFKLRGTNPQVGIVNITQNSQRSSVDRVAADLIAFCRKFMPDGMMKARLVDEDIYQNPALYRMLLQYEITDVGIDIAKLVALRSKGNLTVEHILPKDPENVFDVRSYGFADRDDYLQHNHRLGNLVLLEASINSACQNKTIEIKTTQPDLYIKSDLNAVRSLAASYTQNEQRFNRKLLNRRSETLANLIQKYWFLDR